MDTRQRAGRLDLLAIVSTSLAFVCSLALLGQAAQAQTYTVIHNFTGRGDGSQPTSTLIFDRAGNLYGTTQSGGIDGVVFQLKHNGSGWVLNTLHDFNGALGSGDGAFPFNYGGLTIGPDGALYGTTVAGGIVRQGPYGMGTVFRVQTPPTACHEAQCPWRGSVIYEFTGSSDGDGIAPRANVIFVPAGNLYTAAGGDTFGTAVLKLTPSGGGWSASPISTPGIGDLSNGVTRDSSGNLYGSAGGGENHQGLIFELVPSGSGWTQHLLYAFTGGSDGGEPGGGLILDHAGNLYGANSSGGSGHFGTVFELSPSNGGWTLTTLYNFGEGTQGSPNPLTMDAAGNLYGTIEAGGPMGAGFVYKLTSSGGGWAFTDLHDFSECSGSYPYGGVTLDGNGNLFGTTLEGGTGCSLCGVVWEITF